MSDKRIGFDVDMVLADYFNGFADAIIQDTQKDLFGTPRQCREWNFAKAVGYSDADIATTWDRVLKSHKFWLDLQPLVPIKWLNDFDDDLYFITDRKCIDAKLITEAWLMNHGYREPTVLITPHKGGACAVLSLDAYIDDKLENIQGVEQLSPQTKAYLLDKPYNQQGTVQRRIVSVKEFLRAEGLWVD